jgi:hypothetical protein
VGAKYEAKKRDFERKLRQRRAAELANGGDLGTVKLPPIRHRLRGTLLCKDQPLEGAKIVVALQNGEVVALKDNALVLKFDKKKINKATMERLRKAHFALGEVKRPHAYLPVVDVSIEFERESRHDGKKPESDSA